MIEILKFEEKLVVKVVKMVVSRHSVADIVAKKQQPSLIPLDMPSIHTERARARYKVSGAKLIRALYNHSEEDTDWHQAIE